MTEFIYSLGDFFVDSFDKFERLGNLPNYGIIALGAVLFFWWMKLQKDYNDKAESDPNQLK